MKTAPSKDPGGHGMSINILISTLDEGIARVPDVLLDPRPDVGYLVSHQFTDARHKIKPSGLDRPDVIVVPLEGRGVTKSRNNALRLAEGDIALFSDDDVTYSHQDFETLKRTFSEHPGVDVAIFKIRTLPGEPPYRTYPSEMARITKAQSVGTVQIGFRVARVRESGVQFDERFGAGNDYLMFADEKIFIHDCLQAGLNVTYFPEFIVTHPYESTIRTVPKYDAPRVRVQGAADARINGWKALPRIVKRTIRKVPVLLEEKKNPASYLFEQLSGAIYILKTGRRSPTRAPRRESRTAGST